MPQTQPWGFDDDPARRLERRLPAGPVRGAPHDKIVFLNQQRPAITDLSPTAFVISDHDNLDPAGDWLSCTEPACPYRAYLTPLYATMDEAVAAIDARGRALSRK